MADTTVVFYVALSAIFVLLLTFNYLFKSRLINKNLPPSPPCIPIIGHFHVNKPPTPTHRLFFNLSRKYGTVFSLRFGSRLVVVVSSPSAVEECINKNDIGYNYTNMVSSWYGDHWRNLRRISAMEIFSSTRLKMFLNVRKDEVMQLLKKLSRNSLQDFAQVQLKSAFSDLTLNNNVRMVAGKRYYGEDVNEDQATQFRELIETVFEYSGATNPGDFLPILNWINGNYERTLKGLAKTMDGLLQGLIENRSKQHGNNMIHHLLSLQ